LASDTTPAGRVAEALEPGAITPLVEQAIDLWSITQPLTTEQRAVLDRLDVRVADLPGYTLGQAVGSTITLDVDAAGHGWFIDPTPASNEEFTTVGRDGLVATTDSPAAGRADLLTAIMHEMGHLLGHSHEDQGIMDDILPLGTRRFLGKDTPMSLENTTAGAGTPRPNEFDREVIDEVFAALS
jgi:hypothetical protein